MPMATTIGPGGLKTLDACIYGPGEYRNRSIRKRQQAAYETAKISRVLIGKIKQLAVIGWTTHRIAKHLKVAEVTVVRYRERRFEKRGKCERCGREMMLPCRACEVEVGVTNEMRILFSSED